MIHRNPKSGEERNAMEEITCDDDDVNAQSKFALQLHVVELIQSS
jgi:hypothetical protein